MKELTALSDEIVNWKVLLQARDSELATLRTEAHRMKEDLQARECEVATLRIEAHKREEELEDQGDRIVDLEDDILTKDVLIDALTENTTSQQLNSHATVGVIDEIVSSLSCSVSLD